MFKFLKEKIKGAVAKISQKIEEEGKTEEVEVLKELQEEPSRPVQDTLDPTKGFHEPSSPLHKRQILSPQESIQEVSIPPKIEEGKQEKKGFLSSITSLFKKKEDEAQVEGNST